MDEASRNMESVEFLNNWNVEFPNYCLKLADLKEPQKVIGALFQLLTRLGIDCEAVVERPPESEWDEHTIYYWDLIPIINVTRVLKHVVAVIPDFTSLSSITMSYFLQPTILSSRSILFLLFNLMVFNEDRLKCIAPYEEELFGKRQQVNALEEEKTKLQEMLNEQAKEKGKRAERLEEIEHDIKQLEEELKVEKEAHEEEKQELDAVTKEIQQLDLTMEQKKTLRDAIMAEVARKRALRVYDASDIKVQAEQATQNMQEAEEKVESLRATLQQKETALKNLHNIKPNLDTANNLLHDIMKLSESCKELDSQYNEVDNVEEELEQLQAELTATQAQLTEVEAARADFNVYSSENQAKRQQQKAVALNALQEAEQNDKKHREMCEKAKQRIQEIKEKTLEYEEEKNKGMEELMQIKTEFDNELKNMNEAYLKMTLDAAKNIESKLTKERKL